MNASNAFSPGATVSLAVSAVSANVPLPKGGCQQIFNALSATAFVKFGDGTVTASTSDMPIPPGAVMIFTVPPGSSMAAVSTGTGTLYATGGEGL